MSKSCGNCVNCEKYGENNATWACENCKGQEGWPVTCNPPYDEACENWSDNPRERGKPLEAMRRITRT